MDRIAVVSLCCCLLLHAPACIMAELMVDRRVCPPSCRKVGLLDQIQGVAHVSVWHQQCSRCCQEYHSSNVAVTSPVLGNVLIELA